MKINQSRCFLTVNLILLTQLSVHAANTPLSESAKGHGIIQLGVFWSEQGKKQHINIQGLNGDEFSINKNHDSNGLVGLGYFLDDQNHDFYQMSYGMNIFYLATTKVEGNVIQENLFTNLSYRYKITNYPIYAVAKSTFRTHSPNYSITVDAGLGPNIIRTSGFKESSLDGVTLPDHIFTAHTKTVLSASIGAGIKFNQIWGNRPLECGYHFFYLGNGSLSPTSNQVLDSLKTGPVYANSITCALII